MSKGTISIDEKGFEIMVELPKQLQPESMRTEYDCQTSWIFYDAYGVIGENIGSHSYHAHAFRAMGKKLLEWAQVIERSGKCPACGKVTQ